MRPLDLNTTSPIWYEADGAHGALVSPSSTDQKGKLRPSIFMRRWMSRITLEIDSIRLERLNVITANDAIAEGHPSRPEMSREATNDAARDWYMDLWEDINGRGSWATNPWVWVISFWRTKP